MGHTGPYDKQYAFVELFHKDVSEERNLVPPFDGIYGVRDSRWKLIVNRSRLDPRTVPYKVFDDTGFHIGFEEVFDLQTDPGEEHNLLAAPDAEFRASAASALADASYRLEAGRARERLSAVLDTWLERHGDAASATPRFEMSQQVREQLEELGYAEDSPRLSEEPTVEGSTLEQLLSPVLELSARSDLNAAEQVQALLLEAEARLLLGDPIEAARTLRSALDASPPRERADVETRAQELGLELPPGAGDT